MRSIATIILALTISALSAQSEFSSYTLNNLYLSAHPSYPQNAIFTVDIVYTDGNCFNTIEVNQHDTIQLIADVFNVPGNLLRLDFWYQGECVSKYTIDVSEHSEWDLYIKTNKFTIYDVIGSR